MHRQYKIESVFAMLTGLSGHTVMVKDGDGHPWKIGRHFNEFSEALKYVEEQVAQMRKLAQPNLSRRDTPEDAEVADAVQVLVERMHDYAEVDVGLQPHKVRSLEYRQDLIDEAQDSLLAAVKKRLLIRRHGKSEIIELRKEGNPPQVEKKEGQLGVEYMIDYRPHARAALQFCVIMRDQPAPWQNHICFASRAAAEKWIEDTEFARSIAGRYRTQYDMVTGKHEVETRDDAGHWVLHAKFDSKDEAIEAIKKEIDHE